MMTNTQAIERNQRLENELLHLHLSLNDAYDEIGRLYKLLEAVRKSAANTDVTTGMRKEIIGLLEGERFNA